MPRRVSARPAAPILVALALAALALGPVAASPGAPSAAALSRWTGSIDLYRAGVFTTQRSWLWCTAADVQIMRNIVHRAADHSTTNQRRYFTYMRAHNRYRIPVSDGVDPAGWTAGLRHYVDGRYRLVASRSFDAAVHSAVTNLRKTNLPVGITVSHGGHAWVLTGFSATADPAKTSRFTVTSVRVVGPLWGLQSRSYGYDMAPDRKLTVSQLRGFFTPWHYGGVRMAWEGRWVSVQPFPAAAATSTAAPKATPKPTPRPTARPTPTPTPSPTAPPLGSPPLDFASGQPGEAGASLAPAAIAVGEPTPGASGAEGSTPDSGTVPAAEAQAALAVLAWIALAGGAVVVVRMARLRRMTR